MPLRKLDPDAWKASVRRALIVGGPNTRKTSSLATWPRPLHAVIYPGEGGAASLAPGPDVHVYGWEADPSDREDPGKVLAELRQLVVDILSGKHGPIQTFAGDGLHKLYDVIMEEATGGAYQEGADFEAKLYGRAHQRLVDHLKLVKSSSVPYAVFTVWDGAEPLKESLEGTGSAKGPRAIFPELPGKMAKRVMGEFPVVLYAELDAPPVLAGGKQRAWWRIVPNRDVRAAGTKLPPRIAASLPATVPQNWMKLEPLLLGEASEPTPTTQGVTS